MLVFRPYFSGIRELWRLPSSLVSSLPFWSSFLLSRDSTSFFFENVFVNHILWGKCDVVSAAEGIEPGLVCLCRVGYRCSLYCCLHVTFHLTIPASLLLPLPFAICINPNLLPFCSAFCQRFPFCSAFCLPFLDLQSFIF